jgi:hypothetical protein
MDKADHLEKALPLYRNLFTQVASTMSDGFIVIDDLYRQSADDQPRVLGYVHRAVKDTGIWIKVGSIRDWTKLYAGGPPAVGVQAPHDIKEFSLDRGLLDFQTSKRFLESILEALAAEVSVDTKLLLSEGARDRFVLASGGVPRDYIGLVSEAVAVARNRGPTAKSGSERVIAEDVNGAAGRSVEAKLADLQEDAPAEAADLRKLLIQLTDHCRATRSACFLVDALNEELVKRVNRLQNMRFVHAIAINESIPDSGSSRYNVYLLDVSQLAAQRAWQVEFMGWRKRQNRRSRRLVFTPEAAVGSAAAVPEPSPSQTGAQEATDGVLGPIEPAEGPGQIPVL